MQFRNVLTIAFLTVFTTAFFHATVFAQILPTGVDSDTPSVCTNITNNGYIWRIQSDHFPLQVGDRMVITMFKNGVELDSCEWYKDVGGYDNFNYWKGTTLSISSVNSDDGGHYQLLKNGSFDDRWGSPVSEIKLHVFSTLSQEFSDACEAPDLKFFARDNNVWSVKKNLSQDRPDVIEIGIGPSTLAPVLFTTLEGPGTLSFTLGNDSVSGNIMSCVFRIIDSLYSDTILTYKIENSNYIFNAYKQYTFNLDYRTYTIEWQMEHPINVKGGYKSLQLDSIIFTPDQIVASSPSKNCKDKITLQKNSVNNNLYDISGRTIQKFTQSSSRNKKPRVLIKPVRK